MPEPVEFTFQRIHKVHTFPITNLFEAGFSLIISIQTVHHSRWNAETDKRIWLFYIKPDIKEIYKVIKQIQKQKIISWIRDPQVLTSLSGWSETSRGLHFLPCLRDVAAAPGALLRGPGLDQTRHTGRAGPWDRV